MASSRNFAYNTISILSITLTSKVARVVGFFLIALALPTRKVGEWSLVWASIEIVTGLTDFGVDWVIVRRLALDSQRRSRALATSIAARLLLSAAAYTLALALSATLGFGPHILLLSALAGLTLFLRGVTNSLTAPLQADLAMARLLGANLAGGIFYLAAISLALWLSPSLTVLLTLAVAADAVVLALTLRVAHRAAPLVSLPSWDDTRTLLVEAAPLGISAIFIAAYFRLDTLILGSIGGVVSVGIYSVAYRSTESFLLLSIAYGRSLYPVFSVWAERNVAHLRRLFEQNFCAVVSGTSLLCLLVSTYAEPAIARTVPKYLASAPSIAVLIWSIVFMFANSITGVAINSLGWHRVFVRVTAVNLAVNLGLNVLLIPRWQIIGASVATVGTEMVNILQQALILRRITGLRVHLVWFFVLAAGAGTYLLTAVVHRSMPVFVILALAMILTSRMLGYYRGFLSSLRSVRGFNAPSQRRQQEF